MKEIIGKIEKEIIAIKEQQKELEVLTNNSEMLKDEMKKAQEEKNTILDKESGFYKELAEKEAEKEAEFRQANTKRMMKEDELNKLFFEKKVSIIKDLEEKKKYIDENRNVDLQGVNLKELKEEKEKLEKEIKLNDTTKEEFEQMSDSEKQEVRKAKENYLKNKHRLNEIAPTVKLMETLDGKKPKDKFMEIEGLINTINNKFNKDGLDEMLEIIGKSTEQQKEEKVEDDSKESEKKTEEQQKEEQQNVKQQTEKSSINTKIEESETKNASLNETGKKTIFDKIKEGFSKIKNIKLIKTTLDKVKEIFSKIKNIKLINGKGKLKVLGSGENTKAQEQKEKAVNLIKKDREAVQLKDRVKVENRDNEIEKMAQKVQKDTEEQMRKDIQSIQQNEEVEK